MAFLAIFNFQSHGISFSDWVTLLTLCLAPLVAHIAAGVPPPTYLHSKRPRWHDSICHYNPTSIIWRYLAIIDRRCRAKSWTPVDMAASNAIFWTGHDWDGSEVMTQRSRDFLVRAPNHHHIEPASMSTITTIIVTLQGAQALYSLIAGQGGSYAFTVAISTIFYPLATLGLLRLPAALWLTNDYAYRNVEDWDSSVETVGIELQPGSDSQSKSALMVQPTTSSLEIPIILDRFHSPRIWRSVAVRAFYLLLILGLLVMCIFEFFPHEGADDFTATTLSLSLLFLLFLTFTFGTMSLYVLLGRCNTTIIPCITDLWYKVYTGILFFAMLLVFILAALETRRSACGRYTTYPTWTGAEWMVCGQSTAVVADLQQDANSTFIATSQNDSQISYRDIWLNASYGLALYAGKGQIVVAKFDGFCLIDSDLSSESDWTLFERMNATIDFEN
ncbi:uncharacterized protein PAC_17668 [Phialocephala subalpina]|uniref:Uncharacterized protein n=1 Tax=Phialocephala subalpina TaxID=576137 RepID=A0A1L7XS13_9HELO|nr:uncharacterized protein PAC_17668 [Phialocephala subalpina]